MARRFLVLAVLLAAFSLHANAGEPSSESARTARPAQDDPQAQAAEMISELSKVSAEQIQSAKKILDTPTAKKSIRVFSDPMVQQDLKTLISSPARNALVGWQLGWIIFMFFFRTWRLSKSRSFLGSVFTQLWTLILLLSGTVYFVPRIVLGQDFARLVDHIIALMMPSENFCFLKKGHDISRFLRKVGPVFSF
jgi:hypothetical protein